MPRPRKNKHRVNGPYQHGRGWRVFVVGPGGGRGVPRTFETRERALAFKERYEAKYVNTVVTIDAAIREYRRHLDAAGLKPVTVATTMRRVREFARGHEEQAVTAITEQWTRERYAELKARPLRRWVNPLDPEAKAPPPAVQTQRHTLSVWKTFVRWMVEEHGWLAADPTVKVRPTGQPNRRHEQLRFSEARALLAHCLAELEGGDQAALVPLLILTTGLRASEVANLNVRDVDEDGAVVWVADAKTKAGRRTQATDWLAPHLGAYIDGRIGRLFPERGRHWVYDNVNRLCAAAGVPEVGPHGLRRTHITAASEGGATAAQAMAAMGWTSMDVGRRHYIRPGAIESARARKAAARLLPAATAPHADEDDDGQESA